MATTGEMLDALGKIGRPWVYKTERGTWLARIDLPTPDGVSLEVKSDHDHSTHESALTQLIARLGTITTLGNATANALAPIN